MSTKEKMPIFTNDQILRLERTKQFVQKGHELYRDIKEMTRKQYYQIQKQISTDKTVVRTLFEYSISLIINSVAEIYAKYDIEDIVPFDETLSRTLLKLNSILNNFEKLPTSYTEYAHSIINYYTFRAISNFYIEAMNKNVNIVAMPTSAVAWETDKIDFEEFSYLNLSNEDFRNRFEKILRKLPDLQVKVIKMKFGYDTGIEMSFAEIGRQLGVTRSRALEIVGQAMHNIRKNIKPLMIFSNGSLEI